MRKFKFNLESLLVMREWEERRTRQALSEASADVAHIRNQVAFLESEKSKAFADWSAFGGASFKPVDRISVDSQISSIDFRVRESNEKLEVALQQRKIAMEALSMATRRKRAVENLKEKRLTEHTAEVFKQEANEIEDMFNARRGTL